MNITRRLMPGEWLLLPKFRHPLLLLLLLPSFAPGCLTALEEDACIGSAAKVRQLILYDLRNDDAASIAAVNKLWQQRLLECQALLVPGSSYGGAAITTQPTAYGFPASRPMPASATVADWVGWMDFVSLEGVRKCLKINNRTGTLQAMRAHAQPNGRFDLIIAKRTNPGYNKNVACPFPNSYAPATIRYVFAYILPPGVDRLATCKKGGTLWHRTLRVTGSDVRHGTSCALLSDKEAQSYGIQFNSGFGGYVDFISLRDMTRLLGSSNRQIRSDLKQMRGMAVYIARAAIQLPWSG